MVKARIVFLALLGAWIPLEARAAPEAFAVGSEPAVAVIDLYLKGLESRATGEYARQVATALAGSGYAVLDRDEVSNRFRSVLIMPVRRLQEERLTDIERLVREGDQLVYTDPKAAIEVLNRARSQLEAIAEGLAANERLRNEFLKTQMLLARSHLDSGNEARAGEVLREVIRTYGDDLEVTDRDYHPRLVRLFQKVKASMRGDRDATVSVQTPEPGCTVLLDGRALPGETPHEFKNLYPGIHYLQVRCGAAESMIRRVTLGKERVYLVVDVAFETALTAEGGRLGLVFPDGKAAGERLVPFAAKFGELVGADLVIVEGFLDEGTKSELKGWMVDVRKGAQVRTVSIPARSNVVTPSSVKALVDALTGRVVETPVAAGPGGASRRGSAPARPQGRKAWYQNYYGWIVTAVGLGGLAFGAAETAFYLDHRSQATRAYPAPEAGQSFKRYKEILEAEYAGKVAQANKANDASTLAIVGYSVGGAALAGGIALFALTDRIWPASEAPRAMVVPIVGPGGGGAMLSMPF